MISTAQSSQGLRWDPQNQYSYEASVVMVNSPLPLAVNLEIKILENFSKKSQHFGVLIENHRLLISPVVMGGHGPMVCGQVARPGAPVVVATGMVPTAVRRATAASQRLS